MPSYNADSLTRYDFPGTRNPRLPPLYVADNHPLHPASNPGRTFVVKIRPTVAAMEEAEQFEKGLEVPAGQKEDLDRQGTCCDIVCKAETDECA